MNRVMISLVCAFLLSVPTLSYAKSKDKSGATPSASAYEHANENASFKREGFKWPWQKKSSSDDVKQKADEATQKAQKEAEKAKKEAEKAKREAQREAERLRNQAEGKFLEGKNELQSQDVKLDESLGKVLETK